MSFEIFRNPRYKSGFSSIRIAVLQLRLNKGHMRRLHIVALINSSVGPAQNE